MKRTLWVTACLVGLLPVSQAWSQQRDQQQTEPRQAAQQNQSQQETRRTQTERRQQTEQQSEARRTLRGGDQQAQTKGGLVPSLAMLLAHGNKAEIELGKLASEKTENQEVRQFAQKMIEDHTQFLGKLKQFNPQVPDADQTQLRSAQAGEREGQPGTTQTPQRNGVAQAGGTPPREGEVAQTGFDRTTNASSQQHHDALVAVLQEAGQQKLQLTKESLSKHEGQDFDMGYLSQQVHAHVGMLSHLKAMKGKGPSEFDQLVDQGIQKTTEHLDMAKKLAKQFEDKEYNAQGNQQPNQRNRPNQRPGQNQPPAGNR